MSKEKRVLKGLPLSSEARAAAENLLASKEGSAALGDALNAAILTAAAKVKAAAPAAPAQAASKVKKDKKKDKKDKKAAKKDGKKDKDKKEKKSKDKKAKDKRTKDSLQAKSGADLKLPKPDGAKPAPAAPVTNPPA